jgi:hypothetical protein
VLRRHRQRRGRTAGGRPDQGSAAAGGKIAISWARWMRATPRSGCKASRNR